MKTAIILPGFLDSRDYRHMIKIAEMVEELGYNAIRIDPCGLWKTGNIENYTFTNYLKDIENTIINSADREIVLIGHSMGAYVAIIAGEKFTKVTKIVSLSPADKREGYLSKGWKKSGVRIELRDLPNNPRKTREFRVPFSFALDEKKYKALATIKRINKPIMLFIGLEDTVNLPEVTEKLIKNANNPYVVREPGIGHDFRFSEDKTAVVVERIKKFLLHQPI